MTRSTNAQTRDVQARDAMSAAERRHHDELAQARVARMNVSLRGADAHHVIRAALEDEFPDQLALVSSMGAESAVTLHLVAQQDPSIPVLFLETGMHFMPTLQYRDTLIERLGLTDVRSIHPDPRTLKAQDPKNDLHKTDADACCAIRKVVPLDHALKGFSAWITGRKRFHGGDRMHMPVFEYSGGLFKVNPLAGWDRARVDAYFAEHDLPRHPLQKMGYPSIGCWPCTKPAESDDVRAGRWEGTDKRECGIHSRR